MTNPLNGHEARPITGTEIDRMVRRAHLLRSQETGALFTALGTNVRRGLNHVSHAIRGK